MVETMLYSLMVFVKVLTHGLSVDHEVEGEYEDDDEDGGEAVAPNIDTFVVEHEQASEDLFGGVKVDAIAMSDLIIVFHEAGCGLVVTYKVPLFIVFFSNCCLLFRVT